MSGREKAEGQGGGGHSLRQPDYCLGRSTAGIQRVLEDGSILMSREGQWERWAPGVRETWPDPNHLWDQGQVA